MRLAEVVEALDLEVKTGEGELDRQLTGGYVSDLLSDVIGNAEEGNLWVTLQCHVNIVAVAVMKELAGIVLVGGRQPDEDTLEKARQEEVPLMVSRLPAFELVGRLYAMGLRGTPPQTADNQPGA